MNRRTFDEWSKPGSGLCFLVVREDLFEKECKGHAGPSDPVAGFLARPFHPE